jgi:hypothetical protein
VTNPHTDERGAYLSVCAIYRNEAPYLREWVAFHHLVGVERFFLYDNESTDDHLDQLAPFIEDGTVELTPWPHRLGQIPAYEDCLRRHRDDSRWIAFIDLDEFLFSPTGRPVSEVLRDYEQFPGVGVNWCVFGTSGHLVAPEGLVIENYDRRPAGDNWHRQIKSVVDPRQVRSFCDSHFFVFHDGPCVDENKQPLEPSNSTDSVSFSRLRVNHYWTRSAEEYREKLSRPTPDVGKVRELNDRQFARRLKVLDEVTDRTIQIYVPELRSALAELEARSGSA